jgi:hypothetical protein
MFGPHSSDFTTDCSVVQSTVTLTTYLLSEGSGLLIVFFFFFCQCAGGVCRRTPRRHQICPQSSARSSRQLTRAPPENSGVARHTPASAPAHALTAFDWWHFPAHRRRTIQMPSVRTGKGTHYSYSHCQTCGMRI